LRTPTPRPDGAAPAHLLLNGRHLYLGYEGNKWGGALYRLDLNTGRYRRMEPPPDKRIPSALPVTDIEMGPRDSIWAAQGLDLSPSTTGAVKWFDGKKWRTSMSIDGKHGNPASRNAYRWEHPLTVARAVAFDPDGKTYLLTDSVGVARLEKDEWRVLTERWPSDARPVSMLIDGKATAYIALRKAGIISWKLRTGEMRRITISTTKKAAR
jgi:sugar lactone lactonase YvrE